VGEGVVLELLGQKFLINLKDPFMYGGWQLFSSILLVEVEGSLFKRWVALYPLVSVWRRGDREKHMHALSRIASPGVAWRSEAMGTGARRACEWSTDIWPKVSQVRSLLLSFIFATSLCLICFNRDRPSRLRDVVTLGRYSL
jgi:hypothetical protein